MVENASFGGLTIVGFSKAEFYVLGNNIGLSLCFGPVLVHSFALNTSLDLIN